MGRWGPQSHGWAGFLRHRASLGERGLLWGRAHHAGPRGCHRQGGGAEDNLRHSPAMATSTEASIASAHRCLWHRTYLPWHQLWASWDLWWLCGTKGPSSSQASMDPQCLEGHVDCAENFHQFRASTELLDSLGPAWLPSRTPQPDVPRAEHGWEGCGDGNKN